jgi:phospholipid transport system substrate-binding protein
MMRIRSLALLLATVALPAFGSASPAVAAGPSAFVTRLNTQIGQILGDKDLTPTERRQRFHDLLDQDVDFPSISRFVLGRHWEGSSGAFRQEFTNVFEDYVVQALIARLAEYGGDSIDVTGTRTEGEHSTVVSTTMVYPSGAPVSRIDWLLRNTPAGFKIEDVNDSGVSLAVFYREQFATVIGRNDGQVAGLIPEMRQKLDDRGSYSVAGDSQPPTGTVHSNAPTDKGTP